MLEKLFAALGLLVCAALLLRMLLPQRRRQRLDAAVQRGWRGTQDALLRLRQWRTSRVHQASAAEEARRVIQRARSGVQQEGNVYRPDSFKRPKKPH